MIYGRLSGRSLLWRTWQIAVSGFLLRITILSLLKCGLSHAINSWTFTWLPVKTTYQRWSITKALVAIRISILGRHTHQRVHCPVLTASKDLQAWRWLPQWGHNHAGIFAARGNPHDLTFGARLRAETRASRAPYLRKFGNPSIREILVITWPYARPSAVRTTGIQCEITRLPPFSLIRDFRKQNTRGNVSKISVNHACYRQIGSKSTNHNH